jgi:peptidyl-prolyl cis-trans isomerase B (cyclophilin B)
MVGVLIAGIAGAQIAPVKMYNGIGRPLLVEIQQPTGVEGDLLIRLLRREAEGGFAQVAESGATAGRADLATLFPMLWTEGSPVALYAQVYAGERAVGPALVLQPMLTPERAHLMVERAVTEEDGLRVVPQITQDAAQGRPMFESEQIQLRRLAGQAAADREVVYSGIRAYVDKHVVLDTTLGEIEIMLRPDAAPNTAFNFLHLAEHGLYDGVMFHRIVLRSRTGHPFVIQGGDPSGGGSGGPGYMIDLEPTTLAHGFGVVSMARSDDPDSNGSQFFVGLSRAGTQHLDGRYTAFGQAVRGADVIVAIGATPVDAAGRASDPPLVRRVRVIDAPPAGTGPKALEEPAAAPVER